MIFVTVGSSNIQFDRIFETLDILIDDKILNGEEILAQTGKIAYQIRNYKHFEFVGSDQMEKLQKEADFIICHAGTGTVTGALKKGKRVIVFPRLKKFGEHESDHQLDLATQFAMEGYVLCASNTIELKDAIQRINHFHPKEFISNTKNFCKLIRELI